MLIGKWVEVAIYGQTVNGVEWIPAPAAYPNGLEIKINGEYIHTERCGNGIGLGNYLYNPSVNELFLTQFNYSGSPIKYKVSLLDKNYLILDNGDVSNTLVQRRKFRKTN